MVDPRMAQATAVHTKIATIAIIRFSMVVCVSTLSAASPTYLARLALSSTFHDKVKDADSDRPVRSNVWDSGPLARKRSPWNDRPCMAGFLGRSAFQSNEALASADSPTLKARTRNARQTRPPRYGCSRGYGVIMSG